MENLLKRFSGGGGRRLGDPDWEALAKRSCHDGVIGKKAKDIKPLGEPCGELTWMRCACGLLLMTTPELVGQGTCCNQCSKEAKKAADDAEEATVVAADYLLRTGRPVEGDEAPAYQRPVMKPPVERRVSVFVIVFCLLAAGAVGHSAMTGGSRPEDSVRLD